MDQDNSVAVRVDENTSPPENSVSKDPTEETVTLAPDSAGTSSEVLPASAPAPMVSAPDVAALMAPIATALADAVVNAAASAATAATTAATNAVVSNASTANAVVSNANSAAVMTPASAAVMTPASVVAPGADLHNAGVDSLGASLGNSSLADGGSSDKSNQAEGNNSSSGATSEPGLRNNGVTRSQAGEGHHGKAAQQFEKLGKNWRTAHSWKVPVACACILLGIMVGLQYRAQESKGSLQIDDRRKLAELVRTMESERNKMSKELKETRAQMVEMEEASGKRELVSKQLQDQLVRSRIEAGLTGMKGPGVVISMNDSPRTAPATEDNYFYIVHDVDLTALVNELWAAGAEAVCVNDQRIVTRSSIRCVGPAVLVNGVRLTAPYITKAIGSKDLETALRMPGGFLNSMAPLISKGGEVKMNSMDEIIIPPYEGSSSYRFGQSFEKAADTAAVNESDDSEDSKVLW